MKLRIVFVFGCLISSLSAAVTKSDAMRILDTAPLRFEPADEHASGRFIARGTRCRFQFEGSKITLQSRNRKLDLKFEGAAAHARIQPVDRLASTTALYLGNDRSKWRPSIPNYGRLSVPELYPGIDLVYYGSAHELEYDLTVKRGADPGQIRLRLDGGTARVDRHGNLVAGLIQKRPIAYQISADGKRIKVSSRYVKKADGTYGFALGHYDRTRDLVIDPVLSFSIYLFGGNQDLAQAVGIDRIGYIWVAGTTFSSDLPVGGGQIQSTNAGGSELFLAKLDPNVPASRQIVFYTYIGGTANETLGGMAVGPNGDVYLTGKTLSTGFPLQNAAQTTLNGTSDAFVVWIDSSRALAYSTFLGGTSDEVGVGITYDSSGKIYVTGGTESTDLTMANAFQSTAGGRQDAFFAIIDPKQSGSATLTYSSYLGGSGWDIGRGIALAKDGSVWITGGTYSHNFPQKGNSYQPSYHSLGDAFVAHINPAAGSGGLVYTSYLGGSDLDEAKNVAIDAEGRVVVSGYTRSTNFPITSNGLQTTYGGDTDVFVTILDPTKSSRSAQLIYSTYFGGAGGDTPADLKIDSEGNLYLSGTTFSAGLPTTANAVQGAYDGTRDAFALKFNPATAGQAAIGYLTYLGSGGLQSGTGIAFDNKSHIYLIGSTSGAIFGKGRGVGKPSPTGNVDGFVAGISIK